MPPKRFLVLTFYYPPDLCAGSFRAGAFLEAVQKQAGGELEIDVLTTMPNRYHSYNSTALAVEKHGVVDVYRFPLGKHKSGFLDQSLCFGAYARQVLKHVASRHYDLVFATSSRLLTACLGARIAKQQQVAFYLDIRDIFTDTMKDVLGGPAKFVALPFFRALERYTMRSARVINLVSKGFEGHFRKYAESETLRYFTNGIDPEFLDRDFAPNSTSVRKTILVAGNIGEGQGLDKIIPEAADLLSNRFELIVIGDGGLKPKLVDACKGKKNVTLLPPVSRSELMDHYKSADVLFMHLNDYEAFKKVLPSKIFEYAATGKPILAGVAGYAAEFTAKEVKNAAVFPPCDAKAMVASLDALDLSMTGREEFKTKYAREAIMTKMAHDVLSVEARN